MDIQELNIEKIGKPYQKATTLIELLQSQGANQKEIAQILKVSPSVLSKLKSKEYFPRNGEELIEKLEAFKNKKLLSNKLEEIRFTNKRSNVKSLLATQKTLERFIIIALLIGICILAFSLLANHDLNKKARANQIILADIFIEEIEEDIMNLIDELTLSSPTKIQVHKITKITDRFKSLNTLSQENTHHADIDSILKALNMLIVNRNPKDVFSTLKDIENSDHISSSKSMALVLIGFAHHMNKENIENSQSYSSKAKEYFEAATGMGVYTSASAYNGLAVHNAMEALFNLGRKEKLTESIDLLCKAELHFKEASSIDDSWISHYRTTNNITYIKARLFWFVIEDEIDEIHLLRYLDYRDKDKNKVIEKLVEQIYDGCREAEKLDRGSSAAPFTAAECYSAIGKYYADQGLKEKAEDHYKISELKLRKAIERKVFQGKSREQIKELLQNEALLQPMLNSKKGNLEAFLFLNS